MKTKIFRALLPVAILVLATTAFSALAATIDNPIDYESVEDVGGAVLTFLQQIVGVLAVVFIVIGGILYLVSGGDQGKTETAKKAITAACIGLALVIAGPSFVKTIYVDILKADAPEGVDTTAPSAVEIAMNVLKFLLSIAGTLAILAIVYGGITYFTAAVDTKQAETAKKIVMYSVVGIIVILLSLSIVNWVSTAMIG